MKIEFYLVSAARRAHRLRPGRTYCIGREQGVDIHLQDALASRRHCELRWEADTFWWLVDLNSRNGILVNAQRVEGQWNLGDGDHIQIGGQVFSYYMLPPGSDLGTISSQAPQIDDQATMGPGMNLADLATAGAAFSGQIASGGFLEFIQYFALTRKTGRLDLIGGPGGMSSVWIEKGAPTDAVRGDERGFPALLALAKNPGEKFAFHADATSPSGQSIQGTSDAVLMELARKLDEAGR